VITELLLPQYNGFEVLKEIKRINPEMQVITQTANVMNNMKQTCFEAGFDEFI
jgi:CheY-like chemotaxis protein